MRLCAVVLFTFCAIAQAEQVYSPRYGNDRIIFAAYRALRAPYDEGRAAGGTLYGAYHQCLRSKDHYERHFGMGICETVKSFEPGAYLLEQVSYTNFFWYVQVPVMMVGSATALGLIVLGYVKLIKPKFA